jgi:hypothetical protein
MLDRLVEDYRITSQEGLLRDIGDVPLVLRGLIQEFGGCTLDRGFYRFHTPASAGEANRASGKLISGFSGRFYCFAFDWLGRHLALDVKGGRNDGRVIAVDPGGGEYLKTGCSLSEWHEAVPSHDDPLAHPYYMEWRRLNPQFGELAYSDAIGYRVPLFLGGQDVVENLEVLPREVYFELCTQLAHGVRSMPTGTSIRMIAISEGSLAD